MRLRSAGLRSSELVRLAKSFERTASKRGKEPTYINETLPYLRPLSIPGHPGTLKKGTALSILNHLEGDADAFDAILSVEGNENESE